MVNFYQVLGIGRHADPETIGVAYKLMVQRYDMVSETAGGPRAIDKQMIEEAHNVLSDPVARRAYDTALARRRRTRWVKFASTAFVGLFGTAIMTLVLAAFLRIDFGSPQTASSTLVASVKREHEPDRRAGEHPTSATLSASLAAQLDPPVPVASILASKAPEAATQSSAVTELSRPAAIEPEDDDALRQRINRFAPEANGYLKVNSWQQALRERAPVEDELTTSPEPVVPPKPKPALSQLAQSIPADAGKRGEASEPTVNPSDPVASPPSGSTVTVISELEPASGTQGDSEPGAKSKPSIVARRSATIGDGSGPRKPKLLAPGKYDWVRVSYADVGLSLMLPKQLFVAEQVASNRQDRLLISSDGRTILRVYRRDGKDGREGLQGYRKKLMDTRYLGAIVSKDVAMDDGFVLVGRIGKERFFERVYRRCGHRALHAWMLVYPADQKVFYEQIVEKLAEGYRGHGTASNGRCAG